MRAIVRSEKFGHRSQSTPALPSFDSSVGTVAEYVADLNRTLGRNHRAADLVNSLSVGSGNGRDIICINLRSGVDHSVQAVRALCQALGAASGLSVVVRSPSWDHHALVRDASRTRFANGLLQLDGLTLTKVESREENSVRGVTLQVKGDMDGLSPNLRAILELLYQRPGATHCPVQILSAPVDAHAEHDVLMASQAREPCDDAWYDEMVKQLREQFSFQGPSQHLLAASAILQRADVELVGVIRRARDSEGGDQPGLTLYVHGDIDRLTPELRQAVEMQFSLSVSDGGPVQVIHEDRVAELYGTSALQGCYLSRERRQGAEYSDLLRNIRTLAQASGWDE